MTALHIVPPTDEGRAASLARFRAAPAMVRVSIRRDGDAWVAHVTPRDAPHIPWGSCRHRRAAAAIVLALRQAERASLDGVDFSMGRVVPHPFGAAGVAARGMRRR